ncbi:MAG: hypothetical protein AAFO69_17870, partial [Bacteroidota bacterium]
MKRLGVTARKLNQAPIFGTLTYYLEDMVRFSDHLDVEIVVFSPSDWLANTLLLKCYSFNDGRWEEHQSEIPSLIYNRFSPLDDQEWDVYNQMVGHLSNLNYQFCIPLALESLLRDKSRFQSFLES